MFKRISRSILSGNCGDDSPSLSQDSSESHASERAPSLSWPHTILVDKYTGIQVDDLGRPYVPAILGGVTRTVVDANAGNNTRNVISAKNHWKDLFDYDREQADDGDVYGTVEGLLDSNLNADEYHKRVRWLCGRLDASATDAGRAAEVLESCLSYATVSRKLRATRLWEILLRYCSSKTLVAKTSTTPFLRPVQKICLDTNGHAGLRARMYQVVAGAVLVYPSCKAFQVLWHTVKSAVDPAEGIAFSNPLFVLPNVADGGIIKASGISESSDALPVAGVGSTDLHSSPNKLVRLPSTAKVPALAEMGDPRRFSVATVSTVLSAAGTLPPYTEATEDSSIDRLAPPEYER